MYVFAHSLLIHRKRKLFTSLWCAGENKAKRFRFTFRRQFVPYCINSGAKHTVPLIRVTDLQTFRLFSRVNLHVNEVRKIKADRRRNALQYCSCIKADQCQTVPYPHYDLGRHSLVHCLIDQQWHIFVVPIVNHNTCIDLFLSWNGHDPRLSDAIQWLCLCRLFWRKFITLTSVQVLIDPFLSIRPLYGTSSTDQRCVESFPHSAGIANWRGNMLIALLLLLTSIVRSFHSPELLHLNHRYIF